LGARLLTAAASFAQEYRGRFSGSVTDPQGAAVPKAKVVAVETRAGLKAMAICEDTGAYSIPFLGLDNTRWRQDSSGRYARG
jgi:hypothetical protein